MIVDSGFLAKVLFVLAFPAFLRDSLIVVWTCQGRHQSSLDFLSLHALVDCSVVLLRESIYRPLEATPPPTGLNSLKWLAPKEGLPLPHPLPAQHRSFHRKVDELRRVGLERIAPQNNQIRQLPRLD